MPPPTYKHQPPHLPPRIHMPPPTHTPPTTPTYPPPQPHAHLPIHPMLTVAAVAWMKTPHNTHVCHCTPPPPTPSHTCVCLPPPPAPYLCVPPLHPPLSHTCVPPPSPPTRMLHSPPSPPPCPAPPECMSASLPLPTMNPASRRSRRNCILSSHTLSRARDDRKLSLTWGAGGGRCD